MVDTVETGATEAEGHVSAPEAEGQPSLNEMSDDQILNMDLSAYLAESADSAVADAPEAEAGDVDVDAGGAADDDNLTEEPESLDEAFGSDPAMVDPYDQVAEEAGEEAEDDQSSEPVDVEEPQSDELDGGEWQTKYEELMAPFKAAGREIQLNDIEQARRLMQMGVDYNRKMQVLKPHQKILKSLEKHNLFDENEINFLIELKQGNPEAIKKLLADNEVDPLSLEVEEGNRDYRPTDQLVGERELAFSEVMDNLRESPSFTKTMDTLTNQLDTASRSFLVDNPHVIAILDTHVQLGAYDQIMERVASERLTGSHQGLSDLEAYKVVGDRMLESGEFANSAPSQPSQPSKPARTSAQDTRPAKARNAAKEQVKDRKRAASPTKGNSSGNRAKPNFATMSDDDIANLDWRNL
jgi:hypothetical protein